MVKATEPFARKLGVALLGNIPPKEVKEDLRLCNVYGRRALPFLSAILNFVNTHP